MSTNQDMTAEQALAVAKELRDACVGHPHAKIPWPHRLLHEGAKAIEQLAALTAPRVPDGWLVMRGKYGIIVQGPEGMITEQVRSSKQNLCFHDPVIYQFLESVLTAAPAPAEPAQDELAKLRTKYEQLREIIDDGSESMTHDDAVAELSELAALRERVKALEALGHAAAVRLLVVEDALSDLADYVDDRQGDHECRPLENARRALSGPYISPYMTAIYRICEVANAAPSSSVGHLVEHDPALWPVRIEAARLREGGGV